MSRPLCQGADLVRRTFSEWCDYLFYIPAALDGELSIIHEDLRADVCAVVQLLLVVVMCARGSKPYTVGEGEMLWGKVFLRMYQHVDSAAKKMYESEENAEALKRTLERLRDADALADSDMYDYFAEEEDDQDETEQQAGVCMGQHAVGPMSLAQKSKAHLIRQYVRIIIYGCDCCLYVSIDICDCGL